MADALGNQTRTPLSCALTWRPPRVPSCISARVHEVHIDDVDVQRLVGIERDEAIADEQARTWARRRNQGAGGGGGGEEAAGHLYEGHAERPYVARPRYAAEQ
jgi:hypothetical protein